MPIPAVKSQPTSSEDDGSGGEGHTGGDSTNMFSCTAARALILSDTPRKAEEHRQRYQAQFCVFNAERANRQGSVVSTASGGVSGALSGGGEGDSSLRSSNGGGGNGGIDSTNNTVGSGIESTPTSSSLKDRGEGTGGGREGESTPPSLAPSYSTSTPREMPSRYFPGGIIFSGRDRRNLEWVEGLPEWTAGRTRGETRAALLAKLESVQEEMYALNMDNAPSPGESEFCFRFPIA